MGHYAERIICVPYFSREEVVRREYFAAVRRCAIE